MRQQSGDASLLRRLNSAAILRVLRESGAATVSELAGAARVSRPTAEVIVDDLVAGGWAEECGEEPGDRRRGRPARRFRFRAAAGHVVGVGIGSSWLRAMVSDLDGTVVAARRLRHHASMPAADRLDAVAGLVEAVAADAGLPVSGLAAVGVGTTGTVDGAGRVVKSVALAGWTGLDLRGELAHRLFAPRAGRERHAARGAGRALARAGARPRRRGLPVHRQQARPRPAHRRPAAPGRPHGLGRDRPPVGRPLAGPPARHRLRAGRRAGEMRSQREAAEFAVERARAGDERALAAVRAFARHLGDGLLTVVNPLDPELVVIGGSLSKAADLLLEPIAERFADVCLCPPPVVASTLGNECVVLGAVRWALDHAERRLFTLPA
ncbi:ROK family transcriptional regulator [Nonomuraea salmonea]